MRWNMKPKPRKGDSRWVVKFAFLPVLIEVEQKWVWLERYKVLQYWIYTPGVADVPCDWYWADIQKRLL